MTRTSIRTIEWSDRLSMGIPEIDADHQRFAGLVNDLNAAIVGRMDVVEIRRRLDVLIEDAAAHFKHEIKLLKKWKYPDVEAHAAIHGQVMRMLGMIREGNAGYGVEAEWVAAGIAIRDLLVSHLLEDDAKYAAYHRASRRPRARSRK